MNEAEFRKAFLSAAKKESRNMEYLGLLSKQLGTELYIYLLGGIELEAQSRAFPDKEAVAFLELKETDCPFTFYSKSVLYNAYPLYSPEKCLGFLIIKKLPGAKPAAADDSVSFALPIISASIMEAVQLKKYICTAKDSLFNALIFDEYGYYEARVEKSMKRIGLDPARPVTAVAIALSSPNINRRHLLERMAAVNDPDFIWWRAWGDRFIIGISACDFSKDSRKSRESLSQILSGINALLGQDSAAICTGSRETHIKNLYESCRNAIISIKLGLSINPAARVFLNEELSFYRLINAFGASQAFVSMYYGTIDRIRNMPAKDSADMLKTLRTLCGCCFQVQKAAELLYMHRNSLYDRISKISSILGMDLKNPDNQLLIYLQLLFDDYSQSRIGNDEETGPFAYFSRDNWRPVPAETLPECPDELLPKTIEFEKRAARLTSKPFELMDLIYLAGEYTGSRSLDLISSGDCACFTRYNSMGLFNSMMAIKTRQDYLTEDYEFACLKRGSVSSLICKVQRGSTLLGYLCLGADDCEKFTAQELQVMKSLSKYAALWLSARNDGKRVSRKSFYRDLIIGHFPRGVEQLRSECLRYGISMQRTHFVVIIFGAAKDNMVSFGKALEQSSGGRFKAADCGALGEAVTLLIEERQTGNETAEPAENLLKDLTQRLIETAEECPGEITMRAGISRPFLDLEDVKDSYKEASFSLVLGSLTDSEKRVFKYGDYALSHIVASMWGSPVLSEIYERTLAPVINKGGEKLLRALEAYVDSGFSINPAAKNYGYHRNTLTKKIKEIEEITGLDFSTAQDRAQVHMALRAKRLAALYPSTERHILFSSLNS